MILHRPFWVITGASSGIGLAVALEAAQFATVLAIGRDKDRLEVARTAGCKTFVLDVSSPEAAANMANTLKGEAHVDVLINAAGYLLEGGVEETSEDEMQKVFNTNFFGPLRLARAVLPGMREAGAGVIANVAGLGGFRGAANAGLYCASKAALATLGEALQVELAALGIHLCTIQLGHFRTAFLEAPGHRQRSQGHLPDYDTVLNPIRDMFNSFHGAQPGDPKKAAQVIVKALTMPVEQIPALLPVGSDVFQALEAAYGEKKKRILAASHWTSATDL